MTQSRRLEERENMQKPSLPRRFGSRRRRIVFIYAFSVLLFVTTVGWFATVTWGVVSAAMWIGAAIGLI